MVAQLQTEIMSDWKVYKLGELCTKIDYGYTASANYKPVGPKFLRITDIVPQRINWKDVPYCSINESDESKYKLEKGDIVIARTGATTGFNYMFDDDYNAVFASYLIRYRLNTLVAYPKYVNYTLKAESWKGFVEGIIGGSAQPGANAKMFAEYPIVLPPLPEQINISSVLSSLDDKIDLLNRQNKTLEALAETLFRQWFIEEADENWEEVKVKDVCKTITKGTTPTTLGYNFTKTGINFLKAESITDLGDLIENKFAFIDEETNNVLNRSKIEANDVIITIAGTIGRVAIVTERFLPANTNQAVALLRVNKDSISPYFLYYLLRSRDVVNDFESRIVHAVQPNLSLGEIGDISFKMPEKNKLLNAESVLKQLFDKKEKNNVQIRTLTQLRDTVLPKLMSGEVRVEG